MKRKPRNGARPIAATGGARRPLRGRSLLLRKAAVTTAPASRKSFPAWIAADESGVAFPAITVTPRVRTALVLRLVTKNKSAKPKGASDGHGAR